MSTSSLEPEQFNVAGVSAAAAPAAPAAGPTPPGPEVSKRRVLVSVASNWVYLIVHIVVSLVLVPFLVGKLGEVAYGVWATLAGLLVFLTLLDLGTTSAINRYVARYGALGEHGRVNATVASGVVLFGSLSALLVLGGWVLARRFIALFPLIPDELVDDAVLTLRLICIGLAFRLLHGPYTGLMGGWHRWDLVNAVAIFELLLRMVLIFVLMLGWRVAVHVPALAFVIANAVGLIVQILAGKWLFRELRVLPTSASGTALKEILTLGSHVLLITLCTMIIYQGGNFVLARLVGPESVTPFSIGMLLIVTCTQGVHGVSRVFTPVISSVDARRDTAEVARLTVRACQLLSILTAGVGAMLLIVGRPFIDIWMHGRVPSAFDVMAILTVAHLFLWPSTVVQSAFSGTSRLGPYAVGWLITTVLIVALAILLVLKTTWAGVAVAVAIAIPLALQQAVLVPQLFRRHFGVSIRGFMLRVYVRPLAVAGVLVLLGMIALRIWTPANWFELIGFTLVTGLAYVGAAWAFAMDGQMRATYTALLRFGRPAARGSGGEAATDKVH